MITDLFAERTAGITGSFIDQIMSLLPQRGGAGRADLISFGDGSPGPDALPIEAFRELAGPVLAEEECPALNYGPTEGDADLRASLLDLLAHLGTAIGEEQLVITSGGMQGLDLVCKLFVNPGDVVAVERPAFTNALATIASYQGQQLPISVDENGMVVDELATWSKTSGRGPKLIYTNPTFQNPSGATLSLERRQRLLELAGELGAVVLEDDPYAWLGYDGQLVPSLYELSGQAEWVVGVHTFAKIICPGVRVGWCVGSPEIIKKMIDAKQGMDTCTNMLAQRMISAFLRDGRLTSHLTRLRSVYKAKRDAMCAALGQGFGDVDGARWTVPQGGFFVWLTLPEGVDTEAMFTTGLDCGVAYVPGSAFGEGAGLRSQLRLSFSRPKPEQISEGVARLRKAYDAATASQPN
jgi:2-aminoadipate transaminase